MENNYYPDYGINQNAFEMPNSIQAEQGVLGGLLLENKTWSLMSDKLVEDDFYDKDNKIIFKAISSLAVKEMPFDILIIEELLKTSGELSNVSGLGCLAYLYKLERDTSSAANVGFYADIVREKSVLRQIINANREIIDSSAAQVCVGAEVILKNAISSLSNLSDRLENKTGGLVHIKTVLGQATDYISEMFEKDGAFSGVVSPWIDFNKNFSGLPNDVVVIAARPGMGKSTSAENIIVHAAGLPENKNRPILVFSLEVPAIIVALRMISALARIDIKDLLSGNLKDDDWPRLTMAINSLVDTNIFIDETSGLSVTAFESRIESIEKTHGAPGLIVVDYLQLMTVPHAKNNRIEIVAEASRVVKKTALKYKCPVLELAQLNRNVESRNDKRPIMSDLAESSQIEKDAGMIIFIYRDEVYNEDSSDKGIAEFIIAKNKNGATGVARLCSQLNFCKFENHTSANYNAEDYN